MLKAQFEEFLTSFKSSASASEASATNAFRDLIIDEDGLSDEYDFMDDVADGNGGTRSNQRRTNERNPKKKYMEMLQKVADRHTSEVVIELDDLDAVCCSLEAMQYPRLLSLLQYEKTLDVDENFKLVESVERNAKHYIDILSQAVDKVMPKETREIS